MENITKESINYVWGCFTQASPDVPYAVFRYKSVAEDYIDFLTKKWGKEHGYFCRSLGQGSTFPILKVERLVKTVVKEEITYTVAA